MSADSLDDILVEMSGVAQKASWDVVGMLQSSESGQRQEGSLGQLSLRLCNLDVLILDPSMVGSGSGVRNMLLENNNIRIGYLLCLGG